MDNKKNEILKNNEKYNNNYNKVSIILISLLIVICVFWLISLINFLEDIKELNELINNADETLESLNSVYTRTKTTLTTSFFTTTIICACGLAVLICLRINIELIKHSHQRIEKIEIENYNSTNKN